MKRIAVLTSGGDAPGMNAGIRSVVRCGLYNGLEVYGIRRGYEGLINDDFVKMNSRNVSNILGAGGTILKTARSKEFMTLKGRKKAYNNLKRHAIDGLIVIGGNGSFRGAQQFYKEYKVKIIGIPGTIDNDIAGSDYTIGCSTALSTALEAIDKIRDTVTSMERIFVVEIMGRKEAFLALGVGLAGGAEEVLVPGCRVNLRNMCKEIKEGRVKGKRSWIIVLAEGAGKAHKVAEDIERHTGYEVRPIVLGHVQRGGSPDANDRIIASRMGFAAVEAFLNNEADKMVGIESNKLCLVSLKKACGNNCHQSEIEKDMYKLTRILAI